MNSEAVLYLFRFKGDAVMQPTFAVEKYPTLQNKRGPRATNDCNYFGLSAAAVLFDREVETLHIWLHSQFSAPQSQSPSLCCSEEASILRTFGIILVCLFILLHACVSRGV